MSSITSSVVNTILDTPPIASGLVGDGRCALAWSPTLWAGFDLSTNATTSYVDAVNYSGRGVLEFCTCRGVGATAQIQIIIDGVTVYDSGTITADQNVCPVGATGLAYTGTSYVTPAGLSAVPFTTSLQIRHKTISAGSSTTVYKYRKV